MKIDISIKELWYIRDIVYKGRNTYCVKEGYVDEDHYKENRKVYSIANKLINKINKAIKKVHGHDCNGEYYLNEGTPVSLIEAMAAGRNNKQKGPLKSSKIGNTKNQKIVPV